MSSILGSLKSNASQSLNGPFQNNNRAAVELLQQSLTNGVEYQEIEKGKEDKTKEVENNEDSDENIFRSVDDSSKNIMEHLKLFDDEGDFLFGFKDLKKEFNLILFNPSLYKKFEFISKSALGMHFSALNQKDERVCFKCFELQNKGNIELVRKVLKLNHELLTIDPTCKHFIKIENVFYQQLFHENLSSLNKIIVVMEVEASETSLQEVLDNFKMGKRKLKDLDFKALVYSLTQIGMFLEKAQIFHGDITPSNLFIVRDRIHKKYTLKVSGFSHSILYRKGENLNKELLPRVLSEYSAPELKKAGLPIKPKKAEAYSFALIMNRLSEINENPETLQKIIQVALLEDAEKRRDIKDLIQRFIEEDAKCFDKDPDLSNLNFAGDLFASNESQLENAGILVLLIRMEEFQELVGAFEERLKKKKSMSLIEKDKESVQEKLDKLKHIYYILLYYIENRLFNSNSPIETLILESDRIIRSFCSSREDLLKEDISELASIAFSNYELRILLFIKLRCFYYVEETVENILKLLSYLIEVCLSQDSKEEDIFTSYSSSRLEIPSFGKQASTIFSISSEKLSDITDSISELIGKIKTIKPAELSKTLATQTTKLIKSYIVACINELKFYRYQIADSPLFVLVEVEETANYIKAIIESLLVLVKAVRQLPGDMKPDETEFIWLKYTVSVNRILANDSQKELNDFSDYLNTHVPKDSPLYFNLMMNIYFDPKRQVPIPQNFLSEAILFYKSQLLFDMAGASKNLFLLYTFNLHTLLDQGSVGEKEIESLLINIVLVSSTVRENGLAFLHKHFLFNDLIHMLPPKFKQTFEHMDQFNKRASLYFEIERFFILFSIGQKRFKMASEAKDFNITWSIWENARNSFMEIFDNELLKDPSFENHFKSLKEWRLDVLVNDKIIEALKKLKELNPSEVLYDDAIKKQEELLPAKKTMKTSSTFKKSGDF